jgi:3',5'-nucleoside bisphosphate phosphatase
MLIDLQLHSKYSDGYLSPKVIAKMLNDFKVKVASLTDHNSISGLDEFKKACDAYNIKTINGLELYVRHKSHTFNVLWYNFDLSSKKLQLMLERTWSRRRKKFLAIIEEIKKKGLIIEVEKYLKNHQNYLPVNHLVWQIWNNKKNQKIIKAELNKEAPREEDIVSHYFYPEKGSSLSEARISFITLAKLREEIGGQLFLAHPCLHKYINKNLIIEPKKIGLDGIELLSPHHNYSSIVILSSIIKELDLMATGGSDFHLPANEGTGPKYSWQWFKIDSSHLRKINKVIGK